MCFVMKKDAFTNIKLSSTVVKRNEQTLKDKKKNTPKSLSRMLKTKFNNTMCQKLEQRGND